LAERAGSIVASVAKTADVAEAGDARTLGSSFFLHAHGDVARSLPVRIT
jgi:hypothetical protein